MFYQDNAPCDKSIKTAAKMVEFGFKLLPYPPYPPDLAPNDYCIFLEFKKKPCWKRFDLDEKMIAETEAYFEGFDKSFYSSAISNFEKHWNDCIILKGDYIDE